VPSRAEPRILLVDGTAPLASSLAEALDDAPVATFAGDLTAGLVDEAARADVVVHVLGQGESDDQRLLRSTFGAWNLLHAMAHGLYLQVSSMRVFAGYDDGWAVDETWLPRPALDTRTLACHLGEIVGRELTRTSAVATRVLRLDDVGPAAPAGEPADRRWLHPDDATAALAAVIGAAADFMPATWAPFHGVRGGGRFRLGALKALGFVPAYPVPDDGPLRPPRPLARPGPVHTPRRPERVTIVGAGGPLGVAASRELTDRERLLATDAAPLTELMERPPQSAGAPTPTPLPQPHSFDVVDVTSLDAVRRVVAGADCVVNCAVVRHDPASAFRVNTIGAWNVMTAAIEHGVPKVVFTGPTLSIAPYPFSTWDRAIDGTQHLRSIGSVYYLTKLLGQEVTRLLAEAHRIAAPALLWADFVPADAVDEHEPSPRPATDFCITWEDAGRAVRAAVDVVDLPEPSPVIQVLAPSPTGRWTPDRARDLLGFEPRTDLSSCWWDSRVEGAERST